MDKVITVTAIPDDTVTLPRSEYNELVAAKHERDMILAVADVTGYGCSEIVKGVRRLDETTKTYSEAKQRIADLEHELAFRKEPPNCRCSYEPVFTKENPDGDTEGATAEEDEEDDDA